MAGDWIKWVKGLTRKREVVAMAAALEVSRKEVAATLMEVWEWADDNTSDGHVPGVTKTFLDEVACITGFADAMSTVGWLTITEAGIAFSNFDRNNGKSAKKRALAADRKRKQRETVTPEVSHTSRPKRDKSETREEKRREEKRRGTNDHRCISSTKSKSVATEAQAIEQRAGRWLETPHLVRKIAATIPVREDRDRKLILTMAYLGADGGITEHQLNDALEAVRQTKNENPPAYFYTCLKNSIGKSKLLQMISEVTIPADILAVENLKEFEVPTDAG